MSNSYFDSLVEFLNENASTTKKQKTLIASLEKLRDSDFYKPISTHARTARTIYALLTDADAPVAAREIIEATPLYRTYKRHTRPPTRAQTATSKIARSQYEATYRKRIQKNQKEFDQLRIWRRNSIRAISSVIPSLPTGEAIPLPIAAALLAKDRNLTDDRLYTIVSESLPSWVPLADKYRLMYIIRSMAESDTLTEGLAHLFLDSAILMYHVTLSGGEHPMRKESLFIRASAYATTRLKDLDESAQMAARYPLLDAALRGTDLLYSDLKGNRCMIANLFYMYAEGSGHSSSYRTKLYRELRNFAYEQANDR